MTGKKKKKGPWFFYDRPWILTVVDAEGKVISETEHEDRAAAVEAAPTRDVMIDTGQEYMLSPKIPVWQKPDKK